MNPGKDVLTVEALGAALPGDCRFGRVLEVHPVVDSTNDIAKLLADAGAPEGTTVIADQQTAGRGRQRRSWFSPAQRNLYLSLVLRPPVAAPQAPLLTLVAAVALAEALRAAGGVEPDLKWPNDLLLGGRKVAGILTEMTATDAVVLWTVVGIGLNVNVEHHELPAELQDTATSLRIARGEPLDRVPLATAIICSMDRWTARFYTEGAVPILDQWRRSSTMMGRPIRLKEPGRTIEGTADGLDEAGALLLRTSSGERVRVLAGEIELG